MKTPTRTGHSVPLYQAIVEPQRSTSARNINIAIIIFALASLPVSAVFTALGAWPVAIFIGLDVVLLAAAMRLHFWLGRAHEVITITREVFVLERIAASGHRRVWQAPPHWLRVDLSETGDRRTVLEVRERNNRVEIGRLLTTEERGALARDLQGYLNQVSAWSLATTGDSPRTSRIE